MILDENTILNNRYKIISLAGKGGMAYVFKAIDLNTNEIVAIKILKDEYYDDAEFIRRFDLEARAAASLYHPNIVNVYGVGEDKKLRYIVQEYVEGKSLREELKSKYKLDWRIAVPITIQIALALEHAHSQGLIHRDIKPANILLTADGICKVTDFGIARAANSNTVSADAGTALGSVHYFSPEQARGGAIDYRSDIYSLGILMYELVTGQVPFDDDTSVAVAIKHLQENPKNPREIEPSIPQGLEDIILCCIAKNPDQRYDTARDLIDDLDEFMVNPNERYGINNSKHSDNFSIPNNNMDTDENTLNKVIHLENSINTKRRSRLRDSLLSIILVLLALLALGIGIWIVARQLRNDLNINNSNEDIFIMENFVGKDYESVSNYLKKEGLNHIKISQASETVAAGNIISQSFPEGMSINKNGTFVRGNEIILTVSTGSEYTTIPDVINKNASEVKNLLANNNALTVISRDQYSIDIDPGKVVSISPQVGSTVERGSRVTITISKGPNQGPIPDIRGQKLNDAVDYLKSIAFKTKVQIPETLKGQEDDLYVVSMTPKPLTSNFTDAITLLAGTYEEANPTPTPTPSPAPTPTPTATPTPEPTKPSETASEETSATSNNESDETTSSNTSNTSEETIVDDNNANDESNVG